MIVPFLGGIVVVHPLGVIFALGGLYTIYHGYQSTERARRVADQDPEPIRDLRPGTVEVTGEARPVEDGGRVRAHLTGRGALVSEFVLERKTGSKSTHASYSPHWTDLRTVPFEVDDGTGTVRVEVPPDASVVYDEEYDKPHWWRGTPQAVQDLLERSPGIEPIGSGLLPSGHDYRWTTGAVYPGESVYVRGQAVPADTDGGETELVITGDEDDETFLVSDLSESGVVNEYLDEARSRFVIGTFFLVAGLLFTYRPFLALQ